MFNAIVEGITAAESERDELRKRVATLEVQLENANYDRTEALEEAWNTSERCHGLALEVQRIRMENNRLRTRNESLQLDSDALPLVTEALNDYKNGLSAWQCAFDRERFRARCWMFSTCFLVASIAAFVCLKS